MSKRTNLPAAVLPFILSLLLWAPVARGAESDAILGFWLTQDRDAIFEIYKCGMEFCGKIAGLEEPEYPLTAKGGLAGLPRMDRKNPDLRLRSRPLLGLTIIKVQYESGTWWGTVYNPDDGETYKCRLSISEKGDLLKVRGYLGVVLFGQTQTWTRQTGNPTFGGPRTSSSPGEPSG